MIDSKPIITFSDEDGSVYFDVYQNGHHVGGLSKWPKDWSFGIDSESFTADDLRVIASKLDELNK